MEKGIDFELHHAQKLFYFVTAAFGNIEFLLITFLSFLSGICASYDILISMSVRFSAAGVKNYVYIKFSNILAHQNIKLVLQN
jgi:hypothetical protein